jgi:flavin-dependent dehydrogenase
VRPDVLVAGGGPAGAACAAALAGAGVRVLVAERTPAPRQTVCGEFLSGEGAAALAALGLDPARLGGVPVSRVRIAAGRAAAEADLPFAAWSLARDAMDAALLDAARARGAEVRRGLAVRRIDGAGAETAAGRIDAGAVVLATGKHDVRGLRRGGRGVRTMLGLKEHLELDPAQARAIDGVVEVHFFPGGYAGLQPAAGGLANLCLAATGAAFDRAGRSPEGLLAAVLRDAPGLAARLAGARRPWPRPLAAAGLPYGFVHAGPGGPVRVGDQLAVIPSFCGDGMAIALDSGRRAATRLIGGLPPEGRVPYAGQVALARLVDRLTSGPAAAPAVALAGLVPGLLPSLARATRVR